MTLDEAIKYEEEMVEIGETYEVSKGVEEHRQLAEWLQDYKRLLEQEPCERDETEVMTNQEWLSYISPEAWVRVIHWLYHDYGTRFTDSEGAILKWLRQDRERSWEERLDKIRAELFNACCDNYHMPVYKLDLDTIYEIIDKCRKDQT